MDRYGIHSWKQLAKSGIMPVLTLAIMLMLALNGCGLFVQETATATTTPEATSTSAATQTTPVEPTSGLDIGPEEGSIRVPLAVVQAPDGSTLAFIPVYINEQGPFQFALDTGASKSLIDASLADQLQLPVIGSAGQVTGVAGAANADLVQITNWRAGDVKLSQAQAVKLSLSDGSVGPSLQGLLGSDILSQYGSIQVDYVNQLLILQPK